jgi:hypothetical protein
MHLDKVIALVTGAGSGLGRATALRLIRNGGRVTIADLNVENESLLEAVKALGPSFSKSVILAKTDVTSEESVNSTLDLIEKTFGGSVNVAVNCAGIAIAKKTLGGKDPQNPVTHPLNDFAKVIAVNTVGSFNVIRLASTRMAKNQPNDKGERGVLVNTARYVVICFPLFPFPLSLFPSFFPLPLSLLDFLLFLTFSFQCCCLRWSNRPSSLLSQQRSSSRYDSSNCSRSCSIWHPSDDNRSRSLQVCESKRQKARLFLFSSSP